jgi:hypothetical protein
VNYTLVIIVKEIYRENPCKFAEIFANFFLKTNIAKPSTQDSNPFLKKGSFNPKAVMIRVNIIPVRQNVIILQHVYPRVYLVTIFFPTCSNIRVFAVDEG